MSAHARGCLDELNGFGAAVAAHSKVVVARSITWLDELSRSDGSLSVSFFQQVAAGMRVPEDNEWDRGRTAVEAMVFPNYNADISYAALTLDSLGVQYYGPYSVVLRAVHIEDRASVFDENPFLFMRHHSVMPGDPLPPGYRATWNERGELAKAKLHAKLAPGMATSDYARTLLNQGTADGNEDFIEVHIFGGIHRRAIEKVIGPSVMPRQDRPIWRSIKSRLIALGAEVEEH